MKDYNAMLAGARAVTHDDPEKAAREYEKIIDAFPDKVEACMELGKLYIKHHAFDEAVPHLRNANKLRQDDTDILFNLACALLHMEESDSHGRNTAIEALVRVITLEPDHAPAHCELGTAYFDNNEFELSEKHLTTTIRLDAQNATAYTQLGLLMQTTAHLDRAKEYLATAIRLEPQCDKPHCILGYVHLDKGEIPQAIERFKAAISHGGEYILRSYTGLGAAHMAAQEYTEAIECFNMHLQTDDTSPYVHLNLGIALTANERYREALEAFKHVLEREPGNDDAIEHIHALEQRGVALLGHPAHGDPDRAEEV